MKVMVGMGVYPSSGQLQEYVCPYQTAREDHSRGLLITYIFLQLSLRKVNTPYLLSPSLEYRGVCLRPWTLRRIKNVHAVW